MKLHLPKALFTVVIAAFACVGNVFALTVTSTVDNTVTNTINTSEDYTGNGISYDADTGVITFNHNVLQKFDSTITLNYTALTGLPGKTDLLYITTQRGSWGFRATGATGDSAAVIGNNLGNDRTDGTSMSAADLSTYASATDNANIRVVDGVTYIDSMKALIDATASNGNGSQLKTAEGTDVYFDTGLKYTPNQINSVTLDKNLVSSVKFNGGVTGTTVSNVSGTWTRSYTSNQVISVNAIRAEASDATILNGTQLTVEGGAASSYTNIKKGGDIIVGGGNARLSLSTWSSTPANSGAIALTNDIYLGSSTAANGALHFNAYSGTIDLSGTVTLVEDSKMTKEKNKDNKNNWVTLSGDVSDGTGDNYTLTLSADSSGGSFDYVKFAGNVDLGGLTLAGAGGSDITFSNADAEKTVQIGTLTTQGGAHKVTFDEATTIGTLSMAAGSSLSIGGACAVSITKGGTLAGTLDNTNANLSISGTVSAGSLFVFDNTPDATSAYSDGENGHWQGSSFTIVDNADGGAVTGLSQITIGGKSYTTSNVDGDIVVEVSAVTDYFVNTTVDYTAGSNVAQATSVVLHGGTLNLNTALSDTATISADSQAGATIVVGDGITLDNEDVVAGTTKATLSGTAKAVYNMGAVAIGNNNRTPNVTMGSTWQGTVVFAAGTTLGGDQCKFNIDDFANGSNSTVEFAGASGYLGSPDNTGAIDANIKFTGAGLTLNDGYSGKTTTFNGNFSGIGSWTVNKDTTHIFALKGDMSQWSGELKQTKGTYTYNYSAAANKNTTIANKFTATGGTMKVNVDNSAAVSMTGDVTADGGVVQLTKTGNSKLTVSNLSAKGSNVVLSGTGENAIEVGNLSIATGKQVSGTADVTVTGTLTVATGSVLALDGALTMGNNAKANLTGLTINEGQTSYTLATATGGVTGSISMENITGLNLAGTAYEGWSYSIASAPNPVAPVADGDAADATTTNTLLVLTLTQPQSDTLTEVMVSSGSYADGVLTLQTNVDDATAVAFGSTLNAKMSDTVWDSILEQYGKEMGDLVKVSFADANGNLLDFGDNGETQMTITINGEVTRDGNLAVTKPTLSGDGTIVGNYVTAYIPEPTSTTLSILALAALAVRRRRRASR